VEHASSWAKRPATSLTPPTACGGDFTAEGFGEIILPALWERRTFDEKAAGSPVLSQMWAFQDNQAMTYSSGVPALTCRHTGLAHGGAGAALTGGPAATATSGSTVGDYPITQGALAATGNYSTGTCNGGTLALSAAPHLAGTATSHFGGNEPAKFTNAGAERVPYAKPGHVKAGSLFGTGGGEAGGRGGQREPEGDPAAQKKRTRGQRGGGPPPPRPPHNVDGSFFAPTGLKAAGPLPDVTKHLPLSLTLLGTGLGGRHAPRGEHLRGTPRGGIIGGMGGSGMLLGRETGFSRVPGLFTGLTAGYVLSNLFPYRPRATPPPVTDQARAKAAFYKRASWDDLVKGWHSLPTAQKWQVGTGGMALLSPLHTLPRGGHLSGPLVGLGGVAGRLRGLAGRPAAPPTVIANSRRPDPAGHAQGPDGDHHGPRGRPARPRGPAHSGGLSPQEAARHPSLSRFFNPDGTPRFHDVVHAPDAELSQAATLLSPQAKRQLAQHLQAFTPNVAQSLGSLLLPPQTGDLAGRRLIQWLRRPTRPPRCPQATSSPAAASSGPAPPRCLPARPDAPRPRRRPRASSTPMSTSGRTTPSTPGRRG
jgi:hypothetical protein